MVRIVSAPGLCHEDFFFSDDFKNHLRSSHDNDTFRCKLCSTEHGSPEHLVSVSIVDTDFNESVRFRSLDSRFLLTVSTYLEIRKIIGEIFGP